MTLVIRADFRECFEALSVLEGPGPETVEELTRVMDEAFVETQALVHVITGSLKGSGRVSFDQKDGEWSGEISYGGSSPGFPHNPVTYAKKEFGKGGAHDALRNIHLIHDDLSNAIFASVRAHS